jgi:hypothetical protein
MKKRILTMKRLAATLILSFAAAQAALFAQTVEVSLLEDPGESGQAATRASELVIAGALDGLFDTGFIGTNARPAEGRLAEFLAFVPGDTSKEGLVDYVVVVLAEYAAASPVPACSFRVIRVRDGKELARGAVPAIAPASMAAQDIDTACSRVGKAIVAACGEALRGASSARRDHGKSEA